MRNATQNGTMYSLTQVIDRHLLSLIQETGVTMGTFTSSVREHYEKTHLPHSRTIEWSQSSDGYERMRMDAEKLSRWIGLTITKPLSIDLLDSVIAAFPPDRRFKLQMELAARQGMMVIPVPNGNQSEDGVFLGRIAKETGEAIIAISKLFDDGEITGKDKNKAPQAISEIDDAISVLVAMKSVISNKALGKAPIFVFDRQKSG